MEPDFSQLFHQSSKRGHPLIPEAWDEWPEEWKTTYYKSYPRLPKVVLPQAEIRADFFDLVKIRKSSHDFRRMPIALDELSLFLKYSCGNIRKMQGVVRHHRAYPSGGSRFPIEIYIIVFRKSAPSKNNLRPGLYHYNVKEHKLDILWEREFSDEDIDKLFRYPWVKEATAGIIMTGIFWRNQNKYGERGYRHLLLEAGHIGQNMYLASAALDLKCCALSGTYDDVIEKLLDVDGITESLIYALALGK